ncbi:LPXTG cell wall anchor domain-containing protein [Erwinia sp. CPCC 100877]|nr:LPXTG cell wall anchor domain-containing protein [Erwinia sp. CPCC 100877]
MKKSRILLNTMLFLFFSVNLLQLASADATSLEIHGKIGGETEGSDTGKSEAFTPLYSSDALASPKEETIILERLPNAGEHNTKLLRTVGLGLMLTSFLVTKRKLRRKSGYPS